MSDEIAIVGMAGRFPGAADLADFWSNLSDGVESVSFLSEPELASSALAPSQWRKHPDFVPAAGIVDGAELFDNGFFGMSLREARWTDPQQRVFLELAWAAMEDAGIDPARAPGRVSVYAGAATSGHFVSLLGELGDDPASLYEAMANGTANNLATKAAFELRLRGEAVTWHTACSTGLAVVHAGCQSLLLRQSSVAIAGAVRIAAPQHTGYVYQEGMILSRDGHCRAFDAGASGTVPGNGAGVVVLRPLDDALAAGHHIYAVIKGSAINNDGHRGVGYTAPSVSGQAEVISEAMEFADVSADDIGYVEAHGTGTPLGDPIEIAALTRAYRASSARVGDCPIGSVKSNIGHLDTAAGVAGLIKVALMLRHGEIPASLHVSQPNPAIDFADSPFYPNTERRSWPQGQRPRRAGVSSFGIGGTNVHAVLEEAPAPEPAVPSPRPHQLVTLSARTPEALAMVADDLAGRLERAPADLADVAYTRALGRAGFDYRRTLVAADLPELVAALRKPAPGRDNARAKAGANVRTTAKVEAKAAPGTRVVFLFPGQGAAWYGMAGALYDAEPVFAEELDLAVAALAPHLDRPLLPALCHGDGPMLAPQLSHPALFAVEHALARTWIRWGARPDAVLGHSFGEYAAACVAGVWTLADAARLAVVRGRLVAQMPEGAMLAVALDEDALKHYLDGEVALAAVNGDGRCVISGPPQAVAATADRLAGDGVATVPLPVRHAFHSAATEPVLAELTRTAAGCEVSAPTIPMVSSRTGGWWNGDAGAPDYWARQMREPVRFGAGLQAAATGAGTVFVEVGPDQALTKLARAQLRDSATAVASLRRGAEHRALLEAVGAVWRSGADVDWEAFYEPERRRRLPLPTYPFERVDCSLPAGAATQLGAAGAAVVVPSAPGAPRDAEAGPQPHDLSEDDAAADEVERTVLRIWQERLGSTDFSVHDDFLELGGNSLLAAQILTRLRDAFPVQLPMGVLIDSPTVAELAQRIRVLIAGDAFVVVDEEEPLSGSVPLSPNQRRLFDIALRPDHWNTGFQIELTEPVAGDTLQQAFRVVLRHHDALRQRFARVDGLWQAHCAASEPDWTLSQLDLSDLAPGQADGRLRAAADAMQGSLDLTSGPLLRAVLARLGPSRPDRLLIGVNHLVIDGYSWQLVLEDLFTAYQQLVSGSGPVRLPAKTSSYWDWCRRIPEFLDSERAQAELRHWAGLPYHLAAPLPRDREGSNLQADNAAVQVQLSAAATRTLLGHDIQAALATAVASTVSRWTGAGHVHLDLWHYGRSGLTLGLDISRTVGWFALSHPVVVPVPADADLAQRLAEVRRTLRDVPYDGNGYLALRYGQADSPLRGTPKAEIALNYGGVWDALLPAATPARVLAEPPGVFHAPDNQRPWLLAVMAAVREDRLGIVWRFAEKIHDRATITAKAAETVRVLEDLADHLA